MALKKVITSILLTATIVTNLTGGNLVFADQENYKNEEVVNEEVENESKASSSSRKGKKNSSNWKGKWIDFVGTITALLSLAEDLKYVKDSFVSIALEFKVFWKSNVEIQTYNTSTWVGLNMTNNNKYVKIVQQALNKEGGGKWLEEDGKCGNATIARIKQFQRDNGLSADGKFGRDSYKKIFRLNGL